MKGLKFCRLKSSPGILFTIVLFLLISNLKAFSQVEKNESSCNLGDFVQYLKLPKMPNVRLPVSGEDIYTNKFIRTFTSKVKFKKQILKMNFNEYEISPNTIFKIGSLKLKGDSLLNIVYNNSYNFIKVKRGDVEFLGYKIYDKETFDIFFLLKYEDCKVLFSFDITSTGNSLVEYIPE